MLDKINALGSKILWLCLAIVVVGVAFTAITDDTPDGVREVKNSLFLGYRESIYPFGQCGIKQVNDAWVILCHPEGRASGGLFEVDGDQVYAVNGTAQTHAEKIGFPVLVGGTVSPDAAFAAFKEEIEG